MTKIISKKILAKNSTLKETAQILNTIQELLSFQKLAVLGTQDGCQPWGSLVAFVSTPDLKHLTFATPRSTRKYDYLARNSSVSMVIDNRENLARDFYQAMAVTAIGQATEIEP
ncbi:pyridoxamine 5'-phosphate oxidase family protein [Nitrosococcus wardiae]|uniref:pyridoxamine 5'-phosphate oxidase family protein n=1 Tax=Nitrosococcus wardiae TaxID=1814290 RepID=UPI00141B7198|nr:pyridoxamine 5'-phosphate oxidase family protein [Nitrosococcus wardiae]